MLRQVLGLRFVQSALFRSFAIQVIPYHALFLVGPILIDSEVATSRKSPGPSCRSLVHLVKELKCAKSQVDI